MARRFIALGGLVATLGLLLPACSDPPPQVTVVSRPAPAPPASQPLAQSSVTPARDALADSSVELSERADALSGTNLRMADLVSVAYRTPQGAGGRIPLLSSYRVVSDKPLPTERYDIHIRVPGGNAERLKDALRKTLQDSFGITARRETRAVSAWVLTAPAGAVKAPSAPPPAEQPPGTRRSVLSGDHLSLLAEQLEELLQQPVVHETTLRGSYTLRVEQKLADGKVQPLEVEAARTALREQLGLDLVRAPRDVEYLIVDRSRRVPPR